MVKPNNGCLVARAKAHTKKLPTPCVVSLFYANRKVYCHRPNQRLRGTHISPAMILSRKLPLILPFKVTRGLYATIGFDGSHAVILFGYVSTKYFPESKVTEWGLPCFRMLQTYYAHSFFRQFSRDSGI